MSNERTIGQIANAVRVSEGKKPIFADMTPKEKVAEIFRLVDHFGGPGAINLDAEYHPDELMNLWAVSSMRANALALILFPARPKGYVNATRNLGHYAANKATAMRCRIEGRIYSAGVYEQICENIYGQLPEYARW